MFNLGRAGGAVTWLEYEYHNSFLYNTFNLPHGPLLFEESARNTLSNNITPAGQEVTKPWASRAVNSDDCRSGPPTTDLVWRLQHRHGYQFRR